MPGIATPSHEREREPISHRMTLTMIAKSRTLISQKTRRAITAIIVSVILWEIGSRSRSWLGVAIPGISAVPPPSAVLNAFLGVVVEKSYWYSWYLSSLRVLGGFLVAMLLGIPLGILLAMNRTFNGIVFPVFEVLRPIPPLAWVPLAIIFWPTQGLSIGPLLAWPLRPRQV